MSKGIATVLLVGLAAGRAAAYVRTTSSHSGKPVQWLESCVTVTPDARGSIDVPIDQINATLERAAANWTAKTGGCSFITLATQPANRVADVGPDGREVVVFRHDKWQRPGSSMAHDPGAIGLTTVFYLDTPGLFGDATILDADIELNGVNFTFTTDPMHATPRAGTQLADLENTLTHELGHVQGLAHNCWDHVLDTPPVDDQGNTVIDCNASPLPGSVQAATMFPYAVTAGEISKRNVGPDDLRGVCEAYPSTATPPACYQQVHAGCALTGAPSPGAAALLLIGWTLVALRRRARC